MVFDSEVYKHIELLLGSIGVIIALFFGFFLIATRNKRSKANLFLAVYLLAFSLRIGKSLFYNYFPIDPVIRNVFLGMLLAIGPSLWFYVKYLSQTEVTIKIKEVYIHYIPLLLFVTFCWIIPNNATFLSTTIFIGLIVHIFSYSTYSLYWLLKQNKSVLQKKSLKIRKWLLYFTMITVVMCVFYVIVFLSVIPYLSSAFLFSIVVIFLSVWALQNPFLFKIENEKYANSGLTNDRAIEYVKKVDKLMVDEKLFLDPELTLTKLGKKIGITSKQLSQAINQVQNQNYSQYVTNYRVNEAKRLLGHPKYEHYKISAIAYDSGFNSISSFNTAFKKITNTTAIRYRQSLSV